MWTPDWLQQLTSINFNGFSGPDFWFFPKGLRDLHYHSSGVRTKVISHPEFNDTIHIPYTFTAMDKKFYIWNAKEETFYYKTTMLDKSTKEKKKLRKKVSCKQTKSIYFLSVFCKKKFKVYFSLNLTRKILIKFQY